MPDSTNDPAAGFAALPTLSREKEPILQAASSDPVTVPGSSAPEPVAVPVATITAPAPRRRGILWLGIGCGLGLAAGILVTNTITNMMAYTTFYPLHSTKDSVQVFNELNQMRQEINQINDEKKRKEKEQERDDQLRQALNAVNATVRAPDNGKPGQAPAPDNGKPGQAGAPDLGKVIVGLPAMNPGGRADAPPPAFKRNDPFAEVDEEIERLERTQKTLNKILDLFGKQTEQPKDR
jgi:hypothetical protein